MRSFRLALIALLLTLTVLPMATADQRSERRAFYQQLLKKEKATFEDLCRVTYMLKNGEYPGGDFASCRGKMIEAGVLNAKWSEWEASREINRGQTAYAVCRALGVSGGLTMHVLKNERYCYRELVFMDLMPSGNQRRKMSGAEMLGVFDKCSTWQNREDRKEAKEEKK